MSVYTVYEPPRLAGNATERAERFVFVNDGFSWGAFLFGPLWMAWHRLWLATLGFVVMVGALEVGLRVAAVANVNRAIVTILVALLVGFEAASLRRWTLRRRGWGELGTVIGDDIEAAERRFFDAWIANEDRRKSDSVTPSPILRPILAQESDVIGLFPEPGASR